MNVFYSFMSELISTVSLLTNMWLNGRGRSEQKTINIKLSSCLPTKIKVKTTKVHNK